MDTDAAIEVIHQLQTELAHVLLGQTDPSLSIREALDLVNGNEAIKAATKFVDANIESTWSENMTKKPDGGPAFPCEVKYPNPGAGPKTHHVPGMSLRQHYAGLAMQGICAHQDTWGLITDGIAKSAHEIADAMIKAGQS